MARSLPPDIQAKIEKLYDEGYGKAEIARRVGVHANTVYRLLKNGQRDGLQLSPEARRGLEDFAYFRRRYMGRVTTPWQERAGLKLVELLATPHDEYLVMNEPPGSGKSTLLTDTCTWVLCRDRSTRVLYGSAVQSVASDYTRRIMNDLTRSEITRASSRDAGHGLAVDGEATLEADYGRFKPANGDRWTKEKFVIAQEAGRTAQEKEASVAAFGMDSAFLGGRYDLNVWDDLVTEKTLRTEESRDRLIDFWETTAETRCEPGGLVALVGQRLSGDDLYRYALDLLAGDDEDWLTLEDHIGGDPDAERPKKYHHVVFPAHDEETCKGATVEVKGKTLPNPDHTIDAHPWPTGCLLDPKRLSWRKLATIKANKSERFDTVYQQKDLDAANNLVKMLWIDGGTVDGITYPGCKNHDRMMWQLPLMAGATTTYLTVDPSPTKNWSVQLWTYHHLTDRRFLIAHFRGRMDSPDFLDYNLTAQTFTGLAEEWWQRANSLGKPFASMIVENNAAQKFMLQADFINRWANKRHVRLVPHATHSNKADPELGIQMLAPLYERGLVDLPWKGQEALKYTSYLISEVTKWPNGAYDDCVMSQWFGEHNLAKIKTPEATVYRMPRPTWLQAV